MQAKSLISVKPNPRVANFGPGDTVKVSFRVREGERQRVQVFQGVVIRRRGGGVGATFTVRRVTYSIGVERVFPLYSPLLESVEVVRYGQVRRAKLYYLRALRGRAARIKERQRPRAPLVLPLAEETAEEPVAEETAEEPVAEDAAEEPVAEDAAEEPVAEDAAEEPVAEDAAEEPVAEDAAEEPVARGCCRGARGRGCC